MSESQSRAIEMCWRIIYRARAMERDMRRAMVVRILMEKEVGVIAAELAGERITIATAIARAERAAMRIETRHLLLSFPLEERVN